MLEPLSALIPDIQNAHKKTPVEIRVNALQEFNHLIQRNTNFRELEPEIVQDFLSVLFKRLDDKPNVINEAEKVLSNIVNNISIQSLPLFIELVSPELQIDSKWRSKYGCLKLLSLFLIQPQ